MFQTVDAGTIFALTVVFLAGAFWGVALFYRKVTNDRLKKVSDDQTVIRETLVDIRERVATIEGHCERMDCLKGGQP